MSSEVKIGYAIGLGAAINIPLGFIPDRVDVANMTDGTRDDTWYRGKVLPFTSGGVIEIKIGDTIVGVTSGARAKVTDVLLASGTWAGGNAVGFLILNEDEITGTFGDEAVKTTGADEATIDGPVVENSYSTILATAPVTANGISSYPGVVGGTPKGFTIGSVVATAGKLLRYTAYRNGSGS